MHTAYPGSGGPLTRTRGFGIGMMAVGCAFIAMGYEADPHRVLSIVTGVLFIVSGVLRLSRSGRRPE